jgi:hypothetical protein
MTMPELREQIEAIIAEAQEEDHHGNLLVYSDEATDSILSLIAPILADAERWKIMEKEYPNICARLQYNIIVDALDGEAT